VIIKTLCAELTAYDVIDGTKQGFHVEGDVCMDFDLKRYSRYYCEGPNTHPTCRDQRFNGTDRFDLTPDSSAPGGYTCTSETIGPAPAHSFPFTMLEIDADATLNGTEANIDGFPSVQVWTHFSTGGKPIPDQHMTWLVVNTTAPPHELLRYSVTIHTVDPAGKTHTQTSVRDWSTNFTTEVQASAFSPPPGVDCKSRSAQVPAGGVISGK
jgi:hypothetical protein